MLVALRALGLDQATGRLARRVVPAA